MVIAAGHTAFRAGDGRYQAGKLFTTAGKEVGACWRHEPGVGTEGFGVKDVPVMGPYGASFDVGPGDDVIDAFRVMDESLAIGFTRQESDCAGRTGQRRYQVGFLDFVVLIGDLGGAQDNVGPSALIDGAGGDGQTLPFL